MIKFSTIIISIFLSIQLFAQAEVGKWTAHIANYKGISLCEAGDKIYCLTETGLFNINTVDNSIQKVGKIEGLSDINTNAIAYHEGTKTVYVGYNNGVFDLIKGNKITKVSDITSKSFPSKIINKIQIIDDNVYLSTDFGIVVYDPYKLEFKETYIIGNNGYEIKVNSIISEGDFLYAATKYGIKKADKRRNDLPNYQAWESLNYIPNANKEFNAIAYFKNKLVASFANQWPYTYKTYIINEESQTTQVLNPDSENYTMNLKVINDRLFVIHRNHIGIYDNFNQPTEFYNKTSVSWGNISVNTFDVIVDKTNTLWYSDYNYGLVRSNYNNVVGSYRVPNGPKNNNAYYLSTGEENTWLAPGAVAVTGVNSNTPASISNYSNNIWTTYTNVQIPALGKAVDIIAVEQVKGNPNKIYCSSGANGVIEIDFTDKRNPIATLHNDSTGSSLTPQYGHRVQVTDSKLDDQLNLWSINPYTNNPFNVKKPNGEWTALPYGSSSYNYGRFIITEDGSKWVLIKQGKGLYVFNEYGTIDDLDDDFEKLLSIRDENNNIISNDVSSIVQDKNEQIWIGTDNGIVVYYKPENIYEGQNFYASKIIIEINGKAEYLMEGKRVTALAVDGANRKWIGTNQSGVFLMSEDGTEQIKTFNTENSPLPSDQIKSISIDNASGEVFIATGQGLMSFRSDATEGNEHFKDVYAFPNPVKPEYSGPITIKGLVENTTVKITDVSGNLVNEMKSLGGQATWDGKNLNGNRVKTGVYLVFLNDKTGEETAITKILFIN